jgi:hypothetical protein
MNEEVLHTIQVLESTKGALLNEDAVSLRNLSDQTIHSACAIQDPGSLTIAVLVYSLSKIIERRDSTRIRSWNDFVKRFNSFLDLAIKALKDNKPDKYESYLVMARNSLSSISINLKPYIQEVFRKASINKASKLYEHGLSLGKTSSLLGITQWELADYTGQRDHTDNIFNTFDVKKRAKMALEFFS